MMVVTPRDLRAEMLAREGTVEGEWVWPGPWRARKAIWAPEGREAMVIGEEGRPQGWWGDLVGDQLDETCRAWTYSFRIDGFAAREMR